MLEGFFSFLFEFIGEFFLYMLFDRSSNPSKKRINTEMEKLKTESWFKVLYEEPNHKKRFETNDSVRHFIGEKGAKRIKNSKKHQQELIDLLHEAHLFEPSFIDVGKYSSSLTNKKK
jgi:hypothetical protein